MSTMKWLPLESNPEIMNNFLENLGVPFSYGISDIFSLDDELLEFIPGPIFAVLLLFPVPVNDKENYEKQKIVQFEDQDYDPELYFMYQTISNACGTVALIHAVANSSDKLDLKPDSILKKFIDETKSLSPKEKAEVFENSVEICAAHKLTAQQGQTKIPSLDDVFNHHFVALVQVNSKLYELDGRKSNPVLHGATSPETFLKDAAKVCKGFISQHSENASFTVLAFGAL